MELLSSMFEDEAGRKRQRSQADGPEFLPLSKKLNNLHISFEQENVLKLSHQGCYGQKTQGEVILCECHSRPSTSQIENSCNLCRPYLTCEENNNRQSNLDIEMNCDLTPEASPHYYKNNKMLFALYVERTKRGGVFWQPSKYDG